MNSSNSVGDSKDLGDKGLKERSDAGDPRKVCKPKDVKLSNNVNTNEGRSKESDRGDTAAERHIEHKKSDQHKSNDFVKCTKSDLNENPIKREETNVNKMKALADNTNLQGEKYNKIMASINKIIQENIHLINNKSIPTGPGSEIATENKVNGECDLGKTDSNLKQHNKEIGKVKKEDKTLVNFSKNMANNKASNCTPLDVEKTVNDVKNTSLVIKIPKNTSGCKLQEKPKMSTEFNTKIPGSPQPNTSSTSQLRNLKLTTENCGIIKRQTRDISKNKYNGCTTRIQNVQKDLSKKPKTLEKTHDQANMLKNYDILANKSDCHNTKVKLAHKKNTKKVKASNKSSRTKLPMPMLEDEHNKPYYEAWLSNTVDAPALELDDSITQRLPSETVEVPEITEDYTDKRFTGTIKVKYGKKVKQYLDAAQAN